MVASPHDDNPLREHTLQPLAFGRQKLNTLVAHDEPEPDQAYIDELYTEIGGEG